jgi:hypothetical protein
MSDNKTRLENIKNKYSELLDNETIQNLNFKTQKEYHDWYNENVYGLLNLNEHDDKNEIIKPLLTNLKTQYISALETKGFKIRRIGGSRRKQSSRRLRKTRQRRKMNNRKSKKAKQV